MADSAVRLRSSCRSVVLNGTKLNPNCQEKMFNSSEACHYLPPMPFKSDARPEPSSQNLAQPPLATGPLHHHHPVGLGHLLVGERPRVHGQPGDGVVGLGHLGVADDEVGPRRGDRPPWRYTHPGAGRFGRVLPRMWSLECKVYV